jgi:hypothetical protein
MENHKKEVVLAGIRWINVARAAPARMSNLSTNISFASMMKRE